jgi:hypothetical protein
VNTVKDSRLVIAIAGGAALIAIGGLATACSSTGEQAPSVDIDDDSDHVAVERPGSHPYGEGRQSDRGQPLHTGSHRHARA